MDVIQARGGCAANSAAPDLTIQGKCMPHFDEKQIIRLTNRLIEALYAPTTDERMFALVRERVEYYGMHREPINWGDLKVIDAELTPDGWRIEIDEAAPDQCPMLCGYIASYLTAWGVKIDEIVTHW